MSHRHTGRRAILGGSAGVALAAGLSGVAPLPALAQDRQRRTLRLADAAIGQADPHRPVDFPGSILMFNLYDFLVRPLPGGALEPSVAESWTVSDDGLVYTFRIRSGILFHTGQPLTPDDVVFSAQRMMTMRRGFSYLFETVSAVEQSGPRDVRFTLRVPFSPFLNSLVRLAIVNKALVLANRAAGPHGEFGDYGEAFLSTNDAGSGPYRIVVHNPQVETVMEIFPEYFAGHERNAPEVARSRFGVEAATVRALMPRREIELTRLPLSPEIILALSRSPGIELGQDRTPGLYNMKLNCQRAPTDDVNFRKAIALALDYEQIYSLMQVAGQRSGIPVNGSIPAGVLGHDPAAPYPRRDMAAARAALAQSRYATNPPPLELVRNQATAIQERFALLLQSNLAELGIRLSIRSAPWPQIVQMATTAESTPHIGIVSTSMATADIDSLLWAGYHSTARGTFLSMDWYYTPEIDGLLEAARRTIEPERRADIYKRVNTLIREAYPSLVLFQNATIVAKQDYLNVPTLTDPDRAIPVMAANYQWRLMSMTR
jgi:peptide/nickel transport system substrate-binding protein